MPSVFMSSAAASRLRDLDVHIAEVEVFAPEAFTMEPPFGAFRGFWLDSATSFGAFSYSWSHLHRVKSIGRYCSIASAVDFGAVEHPTDWVSTSGAFYDRGFLGGNFSAARGGFDVEWRENDEARHKPIEIGNDVWIGERAYIRGGVRIGDGAIIGSNAVVTKDVPPYGVAVGNPATVRKFRFNESTIARLVASRWYEYAFTDFNGLPFKDVNRFLDGLEQATSKGVISPYTPTPLSFPSDFS
ncbi:CatB-related O-acetyltransferase [Rhizobium sp. YIM 134829]|uniref:CatB-related O-acetyltransferase n=1 Tax=Rhizobium sp. YIM 134829 TaxID=3390453 RepID=UPI00397D4897